MASVMEPLQARGHDRYSNRSLGECRQHGAHPLLRAQKPNPHSPQRMGTLSSRVGRKNRKRTNTRVGHPSCHTVSVSHQVAQRRKAKVPLVRKWSAHKNWTPGGTRPSKNALR